ncbi:MAG: PilZ domain-containing protein, partial [Synechococcaceae cyanobacterium]|nr:PilZ domain-containing protein [Synechococcaceae cyanobacterium]
RDSPLSGLLPLALRPSNASSPIPEPAFVPAYVPALHTSFPPPRAPGTQPPASLGGVGAAVAGVGAAIAGGRSSDSPSASPGPARDARACRRLRTPGLPSVELRLGSASPIHATLRDIATGGAGLARRGRLELAPGTAMRMEIHEPGSERRHAFTVHVRWSHFGGVNTYLGVQFDVPLPRDHRLLQALAGAGPTPTPH